MDDGSKKTMDSFVVMFSKHLEQNEALIVIDIWQMNINEEIRIG